MPLSEKKEERDTVLRVKHFLGKSVDKTTQEELNYIVYNSMSMRKETL